MRKFTPMLRKERKGKSQWKGKRNKEERVLQVVFSKYGCNNISQPTFNMTSFMRRTLFLSPFGSGWVLWLLWPVEFSRGDIMTALLRGFYLPGHFCFLPLRMFPVGKTRCPVAPVTLGRPYFFMGRGIRNSCFGGTYLPHVFLIVSTSYYIESDLRVLRSAFHTTCLWIHPNHFIWCSTEETASP